MKINNTSLRIFIFFTFIFTLSIDADEDLSENPSKQFPVAQDEKQLVITLSKSSKIVLMKIPAGTFTMGSPKKNIESTPWEQPVHDVSITRDFFMGKFEITNNQFRQFKINHHSGKAEGDLDSNNQPAVEISWESAIQFCQWLSKRTGRQVRLPTEVEWEYACRAGTQTRFFTTDIVKGIQHAPQLFKACWYGSNSKGITHPVGKLLPNSFGLFDTHGNASEWCMDWFDENYYKSSPIKDPLGPQNGQARVLRGGSYFYYLHHQCRSAYRYSFRPDKSNSTTGFRIVIDSKKAPIHPDANYKVNKKIILKYILPIYSDKEKNVLKSFGGPVMTIKLPTQKIIIDGILDNKEWENAKTYQMRFSNGRSSMPELSTTVNVLSSKTHIYVAFECMENEMSRLTIKGKKRDGRIWAGDSVDIFLDPFHKEKIDGYFHISLNPDGLSLDTSNGDKSWNPKLKSSIKKMKDRWTIEISIPIADLNISPDKIPTIWGVNFTRFRPELHAGKPKRGTLVPHAWPVDRPDLMRLSEDSAWAPTNSDSYHLPEQFGHAIFTVGSIKTPTPKRIFELVSKEDFSSGNRGAFSAGEIIDGGFAGAGKSLLIKPGQVARYGKSFNDLQKLEVLVFAKAKNHSQIYWHSFGEIYGNNKMCWSQVDTLTRDEVRLPPLYTYNDGSGRIEATAEGIADPYHAGYTKHLSWFSEATMGRVHFAGPKHFAVLRSRFGNMQTQHPHNKRIQPNKDKLKGVFIHSSSKNQEIVIGGIVIFRGKDIEPPEKVTGINLSISENQFNLNWLPSKDNTWTIWYRIVEKLANGKVKVLKECPEIRTSLLLQSFQNKIVYIQGIDYFENISVLSDPIKLQPKK
ncbi:MAG: hypothetical protein COA79_11705 [Planctomycetota bacterium]|nr:MAG: hypothetical protein COA79_11705 [Planctomycetota bacterium]